MDFLIGILTGIIFSLILLLVAALYTLLFPPSAEEPLAPVPDERETVPEAYYKAWEDEN